MTTANKDGGSWQFQADGAHASSGLLGTVNTNPTKGLLVNDTTYLYRFVVEETNGGSWMNASPQLQYEKNGTGGFADVNASSDNIRSTDSASNTDEDDTTQRLPSPPTHDSTNEGYDEGDGVAGGNTADLSSNGFECVYSIQIRGADVSDDDTIVLKVIIEQGGADLRAYAQTDPTITVEKISVGADITHPYDGYGEPNPHLTDSLKVLSYRAN